MLRGKKGEIWLDGHLMQKDGNWRAVLNDGWRALQNSGKPIPKYWADKYAAEDRAAGAAR